MKFRYRWARGAGVAALVVGLAIVATACGSSKESSPSTTATSASTSATTQTTGGTTGQQKFANFRIVYDTGLDFLDPGLSYTTQGWGLMWNVYLGLLGYKHVNGPDGATIVPNLAKAMPEVSSDGLSYKFTLRDGLKYSNGKPVKASDFKYAIKRLFEIESSGVGFFTDIVGADEFSKTKKGDIAGIVVDDAAGTIEFKLTKPRSDFMNILATLFAVPVPAGTPAKDQSTTPIPSTGPYMIASYKPSRSVQIVRNPNFQPTANVPATNPDTVSVTVVEDDSAALQRVINGQGDWDYHPVPVDRLTSVQQKYGDQLKIYTPANTYYFFMNTRQPPFDKLKVRQAVNYAIDRDALVRIYGGLAAPTENVLPPTYPQYKKLSTYPHDLAKAKALIKEAGATGAQVDVWGSNRETSRKPVEYYTDILNQIGLKAKPKIIDAGVYWSTIGNQATKAQTGFADWFQDYPHPLDWFDVMLNGDRITDKHNNNYSNADVKAINTKIDELKKAPEQNAQVNQEWANVDKMVSDNALWAPYVNRQFTDFFSARTNTACYINHVLYQFDWSHICVK